MYDTNKLKPVRILKQNERQTVTLSVGENGKKYIVRQLEDDKREIYKLLQKISCAEIPVIYGVELKDKTIVTEEYIDGVSLSAAIEQGALDKQSIIKIAKQVLNALVRLHENGIIHKDVKPDNIIIDKDGNAYLTDFDISRISRNETRRDTEVMGTFGYAPIEQFGMMPTDFKTDIYAFGITLKAMLDGSGVKNSKLHKICDKCRKMDPEERYKSAQDVIKAINKPDMRVPAICFSVVALVLLSFATLALWKNAKETNEDWLYFDGFEQSSEEAEKLFLNPNIADAYIFFTGSSEYEHILFIEDITKTGRIRMGKDTTVSAEATLKDGVLYMELSDNSGHTFSHKYRCNSDEKTEITEDFRVNADLTCRDMDYDGEIELLVGMSEGIMETDSESSFYNIISYCEAWCIKYNEKKGFTLCKGSAVSDYYGFSFVGNYGNMGVYWEDVGDVMGYRIEGDELVAY